MEIVLATTNSHKVEEFRALLAGLPRPLTLSTMADYPEIALPPETGATYRENAVAKAAAVSRATGKWALGDDSGLEVEALGWQPGVRSARYAGERATDTENRRRLLQALRSVPAARRTARFVCVLALAPPPGHSALAQTEGGEPWVVEGICAGTIAHEEHGAGGFGYDPLFIEPVSGRTFAELSPDEKHRVSHRGRAARELATRLLVEVVTRNHRIMSP